MVYVEESKLDAISDAEYQGLVDDSLALIEELKQGGNYVAAEPLQRVATATTLRVRNGEVSMTDGPFAETKEQLAGFFLVEARDLNEALRLAAKIPPARIGSIEVRPLRDLTSHSRH
jgi:hypothetical protein